MDHRVVQAQFAQGTGMPTHTDSVYFANTPVKFRIAGSTFGTRVAPSRVRSD